MSVASRANAGIFAVPANEVVVAFAERVGPLFVEEALQAAGGAAWSHPALTGRGRSIAIPPPALVASGCPAIASAPHLQLGRQQELHKATLTASLLFWPATSAIHSPSSP